MLNGPEDTHGLIWPLNNYMSAGSRFSDCLSYITFQKMESVSFTIFIITIEDYVKILQLITL